MENLTTMVLAVAALGLMGGSIYGAYTQSSALHLRSENQPLYWPRHNTQTSGRYSGGYWQSSPMRSNYSNFQGGGPGGGK